MVTGWLVWVQGFRMFIGIKNLGPIKVFHYSFKVVVVLNINNRFYMTLARKPGCEFDDVLCEKQQSLSAC